MPRFGRDESPAAELLSFLRDQLDDRRYAKAEELVRALTDVSSSDSDPAWPDALKNNTTANDQRVYAMDSASAGRVVADRECAIAEVSAVLDRTRVLACDSAAAVFRTALTALGVDSRSLPDSALPTMFRTARRGAGVPVSQGGSGYGTSGGSYSAAMSAPRSDPANRAGFERRFPDAARVRTV